MECFLNIVAVMYSLTFVIVLLEYIDLEGLPKIMLFKDELELWNTDVARIIAVLLLPLAVFLVVFTVPRAIISLVRTTIADAFGIEEEGTDEIGSDGTPSQESPTFIVNKVGNVKTDKWCLLKIIAAVYLIVFVIAFVDFTKLVDFGKSNDHSGIIKLENELTWLKTEVARAVVFVVLLPLPVSFGLYTIPRAVASLCRNFIVDLFGTEEKEKSTDGIGGPESKTPTPSTLGVSQVAALKKENSNLLKRNTKLDNQNADLLKKIANLKKEKATGR